MTDIKTDIEKNRHSGVDFTFVWSDEAGQRRDLKHPDVRVATLDLRKKSDLPISHIVLHISVACGCLPSYVESGRGVFARRCLNTHMPFVVFVGFKHRQEFKPNLARNKP